jgi:hypothetical protein
MDSSTLRVTGCSVSFNRADGEVRYEVKYKQRALVIRNQMQTESACDVAAFGYPVWFVTSQGGGFFLLGSNVESVFAEIVDSRFGNNTAWVSHHGSSIVYALLRSAARVTSSFSSCYHSTRSGVVRC